jgi:ABC-2 type transport system ATP-binding protein
MNPHPAISIQDLSKTFRLGLLRRRHVALQGLSLEVQPGEIFGFIGPNGAGKTTTIKILVGLLRPDAGQASIFGVDARDHRARARLSYLPEMPDFYDYLRPAEFLLHCGRLSGIPAGSIKARTPEILARVGLDAGERRPLRKFSKGMLQRIGIAQTLLADPDLFIFDEPMSGLDPIGRRWVKDLILELGRAGKTVFFSSHVLAEAEAVCTRVAFLNRGRVIGQGMLSDLLQNHRAPTEILLQGGAARTDPELSRLSRIEPSGPDTLLLIDPGRDPGPALSRISAAAYRILSMQQRHATLEEVFLRALDGEKKTDGSGAAP